MVITQDPRAHTSQRYIVMSQVKRSRVIKKKKKKFVQNRWRGEEEEEEEEKPH